MLLHALFLVGCASTQLNFNTLDLASTTNDLVTQQVLYNFASFIDNPAAVPAQVTVSSGNATTSNSITPNLTLPLSKSLSASNITVLNPTFGNATAAKSLQLSASDSWNQSWSFAPVTDPERMKRLQALYRYAVEWSEESDGVAQFLENFPPVQRSVSVSTPRCLVDAGGNNIPFDPTKPGSPPPKDSDSTVCATAGGTTQSTISHGATTESYTNQADDPYYLRNKGCIVCVRYSKTTHRRYRTINENLEGAWLRWEDVAGSQPNPVRAPLPDDVLLGHAGHYKFYTSRKTAQKFVNFTVATLSAMAQAGSTAATASSSASSGGGTAKATLIAPDGTAPSILLVPQ
ncbi:hypothetical protein [Rhodoplanes sp. Z2-YC6860]|uniref:hypothetical protein n=1 Tax=Rhodoplanes sp. Z2-YC6860 TaxID=674703 RepID=UPI0012EE3E2A|nr:hypothetical protein [Rhodoplanes sp. Z2-YC6860]